MRRLAVPMLVLALAGCGRSPAPDLGDLEKGSPYRSSRIDLPPLPDLVKALSDDDPEIRLAATISLSQLGKEAAEAVPQLTLRLKDGSANVRLAAADALGRIGAGTSAAKAALDSVRDDPDEDVREAVRLSLRRLAKDG
ncbi:MAG: HEAT repeat domain-containing protein [Gemmataceae bacterium]|nr:HEAT repeat domain-containing protein [Gemmataceae bacterium]